MSITITQSNKKDYIGRDFLFHLKKDQIIIVLRPESFDE